MSPGALRFLTNVRYEWCWPDQSPLSVYQAIKRGAPPWHRWIRPVSR